MIELCTGTLSPERCLDEVRRPGSGGIVTFVGCIRDNSQGRSVQYLEYEAYEPMAIEKFEQIVGEASARWPVLAIAIQHRLGRLEIGDDAVVIAVACPHRSEAFEACRYTIDRIKEIVPIWKKEFGEGGAVWVDGPTGSATLAHGPD